MILLKYRFTRPRPWVGKPGMGCIGKKLRRNCSDLRTGDMTAHCRCRRYFCFRDPGLMEHFTPFPRSFWDLRKASALCLDSTQHVMHATLQPEPQSCIRCIHVGFEGDESLERLSCKAHAVLYIIRSSLFSQPEHWTVLLTSGLIDTRDSAAGHFSNKLCSSSWRVDCFGPDFELRSSYFPAIPHKGLRRTQRCSDEKPTVTSLVA